MGKDSKRGKYSSPDGSRTWEYISAIFCGFGTFCVGTVVGWNSPSLNELTVPNSRIPITSGEASTLTACMAIGQIAALPLSVFAVDRIGRKKSILISTVPLMINWGMILVAESVTVLIVARILSGLSAGILICTIPIYMAEILSSNIRGALGAFGGILCFAAVLFMFGVAPHLGIKVTAGFCMAFTMVSQICFWFLPESPYFLIMLGRNNEAEIALEKLRGKTDVANELELIKITIHEKGKSLVQRGENGIVDSAREPSAFEQLFTIRGNLKSFFIGMMSMILQHFCGFHIILFYCHIVFTDMGSGLDVYTATVIFGVLQMISGGITALIIDKFGRKPPLFISGMITSLLLSVIASYFYLMEHMDIDVRQYSIVPLCSIFLLVVVLNMGVMSVPQTIQAEIYASNVKMLAICFIGLCGGLTTIFISKTYLLMAKEWGFGHSIPFFGFAIITFVSTVIIIWWVPETKGKTLLEIQRELNA